MKKFLEEIIPLLLTASLTVQVILDSYGAIFTFVALILVCACKACRK